VPIFASLDDMKARFSDADLVELTDEAGLDVIDEARVDGALDRADAIITGYVASRHKDVPSLAGNALLKDIAYDLAFHDLHRNDPPDRVADRKKDAEARLQRIARGEIKLDQGTEEQPARPDAILSGGSGRRFSRDLLESM